MRFFHIRIEAIFQITNTTVKKRITFSTWEEQTEEYRKFSATTDFNTAMSTYLNKLLRFSFPDAFDEHGKPKPVIKKITFYRKSFS